MTKARIKGLDFKFHTHSASSECTNNLASNNNEKLKTETKARMSKLNRNMKLKGFLYFRLALKFKGFRIVIRVFMFHSLIRRRSLYVNFCG